MKDIFSLLPEELEAMQREEYVTDPSIEMPEPSVMEETAPMHIEGRTKPSNINLGMPIDRSPLIIEEPDSEKNKSSSPSVLDRYKEMMEKQKSEDNTEYGETSDQNNRMQLYGNLLKGFQNMIQNSVSGVAPNFKAEMGVADNLIQQGKDGLSEFYKKRDNARKTNDQVGQDLNRQMGLESGEIDLKEKKAYTDPTSPIAKVYKNFLKQNFKKYLPNMSEEEIESLSPQRAAEIVKMITEQKRAEQDSLLDWERLRQQKELAELARDDKKDAKMDTNLQKFGKRMEDPQSILNSIDSLESDLGSLDSFTTDKDGNLTKDGKKVDLPGVNIPGIGRTTFYSSDARDLSARVAQIFNVELKDRSGAAVTDNELQRIKQEFADGKYSTEAEMIKALQLYKNRVKYVMQNTQSEFKPEVVDEYASRGGRILNSKSSTESTKIKSQSSGPMGDTTERNGKKYKWNPAVNKYQPLE